MTDPDADHRAWLDEPDPRADRDLLRFRPVRALVRSRWYPGIFQVPVAAVFGLVANQLLAGPGTAHRSSGTG